MRRLLTTAALCGAVLLLTASAAAAGPKYDAPGTGLEPHVAGLSHGQAAQHVYVPLARRLAGAGTIKLNVYSWDSLPEVGATVDWYVFHDTGYETGEGTTDAAGHVELTGISAADADNGELTVDFASGDDGWYDLWNMSWPAAGTDAGLQAGKLPITLVQSSDTWWNDWTAARVWLWGHKDVGVEVHVAASNIARTGASADGYARTIQTGPEHLFGGAAYFWDNEGLELSVDGTAVGPGQTASPAQTVYEADAQRLWLGGWGSGKPGSAATVVMDNYPAGWVDEISGVADYPENAKSTSFGTFTSTGAASDSKKITIPGPAAPGYAYWVKVDHSDGPLELWTVFQVCTLKPSKSTVRANTSIGLSGIVPIKGHYGSKKGTRKYVTLYKTTSAKTGKAQPTKPGGKTVKGWTKVGRVRTDGLGKYKISTRPARTTWYCAWYAGDSWYWGAWTSVAKVKVR
jgi:hypothetical protein